MANPEHERGMGGLSGPGHTGRCTPLGFSHKSLSWFQTSYPADDIMIAMPIEPERWQHYAEARARLADKIICSVLHPITESL